MNKKSKGLALALLMVSAASAFGVAGANAAATHQSLSPLDKAYLKDASQSNIEEIQMSPMIIKKTSNPQIKAFAQRMISDHTKNQMLLKSVANEVGATIPDHVSKEQTGIIRRLVREPAGRFPAAYRAEMIRDHTIDINQTRREISLGKNPKVRIYAQETLPVLKMHLKMSKALPISNAMNNGTAAQTNTTSNGTAAQSKTSGAQTH